MKNYLKQFDNCLQHEPAFCSAACPYSMDTAAFISRLQEGRFNAAYKAYRDATGFPFIAAEICTGPCREACLRNAVHSGDPIDMPALEKAVLAFASRTEPPRYNVPGKGKSVAIIGAGISGMACALRLATKKYRVTIYEKTDHVGGTLPDMIDPDIVHADFERQMKHLDYKIRFNTEITSLDALLKQGYIENTAASKAAVSGAAAVMRTHTTHGAADFTGTYDAVYIATGKGGNRFGTDDSLCRLVGETAVFAGGSLTGCSKAQALADGLRISGAIDNYTLTKILRYPEYPSTGIAIDETQYIETSAVRSGGDTYTEEDAVAEANRCMKCQCSSCMLHCDLTEYLHKWPLRLRDEIIATTAPGRSELHATPAVRTINMCTHCGLCTDTCPESIDMDGFIRAARVRMHKLNKMPWSFNDFFLRDMAFTNSDAAYVCRPPEDADTCRYAFFPGCQLGAASPELVLRSYALLQKLEPSTGIMLGCCGIPAEWAGDEKLRDEVTARIREDWIRLGRPVMILACPTCRNTFDRYLPEIKTAFIYDILAEADLPAGSAIVPGTYSVFDPCAVSPGEKVRSSVRRICGSLGISLKPLPIQEKWTACCSYGGHGAIADPDFTKFVRNKRIRESDLPYITYCINCRDSFLSEGKEAVHILDFLFGLTPELGTVTQRRENRIALKEKLMNQSHPKEKPAAILQMSEEVRRKISADYILEDEAAEAVAFCEKTGRTLQDTESGAFTGYRKIGNMTYWVTYRHTDTEGVYELLNAYTHRMEIELEMIWNGEKINIDM